MTDPIERYLEQKRAEQKAALARAFTPFQLMVISAYLRRYCHWLPDYNPGKAFRIYRRWKPLIDESGKPEHWRTV
jgi:hypothetical protein